MWLSAVAEPNRGSDTTAIRRRCDTSSVLFRRGGVFEGHLDHRSGDDEIIEGWTDLVPTSSEMLQDLPLARNRVRDHGRSAIKVEVSTRRFRWTTSLGSARRFANRPRARRPGDEEAAVDIEHPDLDTTRPSGFAAGRSDIDRRIVGELAPDGLHRPDVRATAPGGARRQRRLRPLCPRTRATAMIPCGVAWRVEPPRCGSVLRSG